MALISLKNLVEPFQNKTHLITILLVVIAFAVFRFSGGGIKIESLSKAPPSLNKTNQQYQAPRLQNNAVAKPPAQPDDEFEF